MKVKWGAVSAVGLGIGALLNALVSPPGAKALALTIAIGFLGVIVALASSSADR